MEKIEPENFRLDFLVSKQSCFLVAFEPLERGGIVFLEEGGLDLPFGVQALSLAAREFGEAAAVDDGEVFAHEAAVFMRRQRENLEAELLGDKEYRVENVVARGFSERIVGDDDGMRARFSER